jgi:hypothetical protein
MPRPKKINQTEPQIADVTPVEVEETTIEAEKPVPQVEIPQEKPAEAPKQLKIADNPYLDEVEKELLIKAKLDWYIDRFKIAPSDGTVIKYTNKGKPFWVKVGVKANVLQEAWEFCKDNTKMTPEEFVNKWLKGILGERGVIFFQADYLEIQ